MTDPSCFAPAARERSRITVEELKAALEHMLASKQFAGRPLNPKTLTRAVQLVRYELWQAVRKKKKAHRGDGPREVG